MIIQVNQVAEQSGATVLVLEGELDASNFEQVIEQVQNLYKAGTRRLVLDFSKLRFMSSSGIVALHSIILLMRGESAHDTGEGWNVFHAIDQDRTGKSKAVKMVNPQEKIRATLEITGMVQFFDIYPDQATALAAFGDD
jgi:anti-anti-sigma regulatory factor